MRSLRFILAAVLAASCPSCVRVLVDGEVPSPDGRHVATTFRTDPGAMNDYTSIVALRRTHEAFSRTAGEVFATRGSYPIAVRWISGTELTIACPECDPGRIEVRREQWGDVRIRYATR